MVYPESSPAERLETRRRTYDHLGWMVTEVLTMQRDMAEALTWVEEVRGLEFALPYIGEGRGLLFVGGHYGNWELLAAWLADFLRQRGAGAGKKLNVVYRDTNNKDVAAVIASYRRRAGIGLVPMDTKIHSIAKLLRAGEHAATMPDVSWMGGRTLPFMGCPCTNTLGPAALAMLSGAPVVPLTIYRLGPFRHAVEFFPPLFAERAGSRDEAIELMTRRINGALEHMFAPQPELWFWLHDRWKRYGILSASTSTSNY
jgi:KDO2-lipid IV(A) lauroyltransferase